MTDIPENSPDSERIAKYLARAGVASRREVERMIEDGRVIVNGEKLSTPAFKVTGAERITVDGKPVSQPQRTRLWRFHKPVGLVTTNTDPEGRPTVFSALPSRFPRCVTIGRLDIATEGLLLLTNDGELARALELPSTGLARTYRARAFGHADQKALDKLQQGVTHEGVTYRPIKATMVKRTGANAWIEITLTEGKNREVRRVLESVGMKVSRLIRTSYGPIELGDLANGAIEEIDPAELSVAFGDIHPPLRTARAPDRTAKRRPAKRSEKRPGKKSGKSSPGPTRQPRKKR